MNRIMDGARRLLEYLGLVTQPNLMYIGGSDILPAPLERELERDALERMAEGDESARAELIEHNLRLVVYIARRFENTGINIEDLISSARSASSRRSIPSDWIKISSWPPMLRAALKMRS